MSVHIFVDESERFGYLLAATIVDPSELHRTRIMLRKLLLPGERRVHFRSENDRQRRLVVSALVAADLGVRLYRTADKGEQARSKLLRRVAGDAVALGASRVVLESRTAVADKRARAVFASVMAKHKADLSYEHMPASQEPLLWASDAAAWCFGAGADWRHRIEPIIEEVVTE